jgi:HAMP domain-containing protein
VNFDLTAEQKEIRRAADEFAKGEFDKDVALETEIEEGTREIQKNTIASAVIGKR